MIPTMLPKKNDFFPIPIFFVKKLAVKNVHASYGVFMFFHQRAWVLRMPLGPMAVVVFYLLSRGR